SVVVPSSPGYVGTYHFLCQVSLGMFGVPVSPALSFAAVVHAVNFLPVLAVALLFASYEGMRIYKPDMEANHPR
ncbi:MAG: flippase-like domain-containing protein, partial [Deltaproteobacteria bacterium]